MTPAEIFGLYAALGLTLLIWSYLYKDTIFFRFAEYTYLGVAAGHLFVMTAIRLRDSVLIPLIFKSQYALAIPVVAGIILYTRYAKRTEWISRLPVAILIGVGTGLATRGLIDAQFVRQILATITPRNPVDGTLIAVFTCCALAYFFFTRQQAGMFGKLTRVGRAIILVAMGATFGSLATTRLTFGVMRMRFLVDAIVQTLRLLGLM